MIDAQTFEGQLPTDPRSAIATTMLLEQRPDPVQHQLIGRGPWTRQTLPPGIVAATADLQYLTEKLQGILPQMLADELVGRLGRDDIPYFGRSAK